MLTHTASGYKPTYYQQTRVRTVVMGWLALSRSHQIASAVRGVVESRARQQAVVSTSEINADPPGQPQHERLVGSDLIRFADIIDMTRQTRRSFTKLLGGLPVAALGPTRAAASGPDSDTVRLIVDLQQTDRARLPDDLEIVHDLREIDLLVIRGSPELLRQTDATAFTPDLSVRQHEGFERSLPTATRTEETHPKDVSDADVGPAEEYAESDLPDHPAEPTRRHRQWSDHARSLSEEVHDEVTGTGSRIAVVDSGVFDEHPDLAGSVNTSLSRNFTDDGGDFRPQSPRHDHGTHVAGIAAAGNEADPDGDTGVIGVAPDAEIVALRVFGSNGGAATGDVLAAVVYAAKHGCDAVNLSLGFPSPFVYLDRHGAFLRRVRDLYARAFEFARSHGTVPITSAGNDGLDMTDDNVLVLPADAPGTLTVSATGPIGYLWDDAPTDGIEPEKALEGLREPAADPAFYTNYGAIDVSACGGNMDLEASESAPAECDLVLSTVAPDTGWGYKGGTSMAAPHVAGAIALVRSQAPEMTVDRVESLLRSTADDCDQTYHGDGFVNFVRLIDAVEDVDIDTDRNTDTDTDG